MSVQNPGTPEPAKVDAAPPAQQPTTPAATPPAAKPQLLTELEALVGDKAPTVYEHVKEARLEAKTHRIEKQQLAEENAALKASLAKAEEDKRLQEEERLKQQNDYKTLYENEKAQREEALRTARQSLISRAIEARAAQDGIHPKLIQLIDKRGVAVDGDGNVTGLDAAIERFKTTNEDLIEIARPKPGAAAGGDPTTPPAGATTPPSTNPADWMIVPGTNMTYKQYRDMANGTPPTVTAANPGAAPVAKVAKGNDTPDLKKADKKTADEWYQNYKQKLPKR